MFQKRIRNAGVTARETQSKIESFCSISQKRLAEANEPLKIVT